VGHRTIHIAHSGFGLRPQAAAARSGGRYSTQQMTLITLATRYRLFPSPWIESGSVDMVTMQHTTSVKMLHYDLVFGSQERIAVTTIDCPIEISQWQQLYLSL
jgi:hypothetical protein